MIQYVLACVMWAKPNVETFQVKVQDGMAFMNQTVGDYTFEASVMEERMNYMQITYNPLDVMTQANSPGYGETKSMTLRLNAKDAQASIDCEIKK